MNYDAFRGALDSKRQQTKKGVEYWAARDIQAILGYVRWENFETAIQRAKEACRSAGQDPHVWFRDAAKPIVSGRGGMQLKGDFFLTRFACYLIAMNGDTAKPEVAMAQAYFAIQTRKQEKLEERTEEERRIEKRRQVADHNKQLAGAAKQSGVDSVRFGIFQDHGYQGLYEMSSRAIKERKGIPIKDNLLDYAGFEELAANDFRITQTARQLVERGVKSERIANEVHYSVGRKVRETIIELGNPTPENLPIEPHIKTLTKKKPQKPQKQPLLLKKP
jgi:DNA-damage-inducible protein D